MSYKDLLTEEQKEAFRKGDKYYKSPFKNMKSQRALVECHVSTTVIYTTTSFTRIHEALVDSWSSRSWN